MKFLVDNAVSPFISRGLQQAGYDAVHVQDYGMAEASDDQIIDRAAIEQRIVFSSDTDVGTLLSQRKTQEPSIILLRGELSRFPPNQLQTILRNLPAVQTSLEAGAIVVFEKQRIRVRNLPLP